MLFDVCCGTGTIGLTLASRVQHVVGIELNSQAVEDAKQNAEINGKNSLSVEYSCSGTHALSVAEEHCTSFRHQER